MEKKLLNELTDQELVEKLRSRKKERIFVAILMGFLIGCAVWSATHKGSFYTLLILVTVIFIGKKYSGKVVEVTNEIEARKVL